MLRPTNGDDIFESSTGFLDFVSSSGGFSSFGVSSDGVSVTTGSFDEAAAPAFEPGKFPRQYGSEGDKADIAIGVEVAELGLFMLFLSLCQPKNRFANDETISAGDVVAALSTGGTFSVAGDGNVVISFRGDSLGVILRVALGFEGELMGSPRMNVEMDSV